jgi:hypothetical protein
VKAINLMIIAFLFSCAENRQENISKVDYKNETLSSNFGGDSIDNLLLDAKKQYSENKNLKIISMKPVFLDTVVGEFSLEYLYQNNQELVEIGSSESNIVRYFETELIVNVVKSGNTILENKAFRKGDFFTKSEDVDLRKFMITNVTLKDLSSDNCLLEVTICQPDTDYCFFYNVEIDQTGNVSLNEIEIDYSEDW